MIYRSLALLLAIVAPFGLYNQSEAFAATPARGIIITTGTTVERVMALDAALDPKLVMYAIDNPDAKSQSVAEYQQWITEEIARINVLLPVMDALGMKVLLRLASPPGGHIVGTNPPVHGPFHSAEFRKGFLDTWQTLATAFKDSNVIVAYSMLSEPADPSAVKWNSLAQETVSLINKIDPTKLLFMGVTYGNPARLTKLKLPKGKNVALEFHYYLTTDVFKFVHQRIYNSLTIPYPSKGITKSSMKKAFHKVMAKVKQKRISSVYVNEVTVPRWAPNGSQYLKDVLSIIESGGAKGWCYLGWGFGGNSPFSVEHTEDINNPNPATSVTARALVLKNLFSKSALIKRLR